MKSTGSWISGSQAEWQGGAPMEIALAEQGVFVLPAKVTQDQAREKAWEQKLNVFGTLAKFLMRFSQPEKCPPRQSERCVRLTRPILGKVSFKGAKTSLEFCVEQLESQAHKH
jgi:hypothetical protein